MKTSFFIINQPKTVYNRGGAVCVAQIRTRLCCGKILRLGGKQAMVAAATIDEISVDYTDEATGCQTVRQLDKQVLSKGAWTTIMFLYTEWDRKKECWGAPKARIDRFQKKNGVYISQSKFKFTSAKQARQIMDIFDAWMKSGQFEDVPE